MAKGVEDTAFYRYQPLVSLNEVGGDPGRFGRPAADFHARMAHAARHWPETMLTLSTHDTKRSGDVRARISVLSELPGAWESAVVRWAEQNTAHKQDGWPDRNAEYLLYQTLVGAWPIEAGRAGAFMLKAAKEAKVHTSWTDPNAGYDDALSAFVTAVLADRDFVADLEAFLAEHRIVERGRVNSLAQTALMLTCPGVPDLYQGTEVWDVSLVDPDNRRPVDYARAPRPAGQPGRGRPRGRAGPRRGRRPEALADPPGARAPAPSPRCVRPRFRLRAAELCRRQIVSTSWPSRASNGLAVVVPRLVARPRRRTGRAPRSGSRQAPGPTCSPASRSTEAGRRGRPAAAVSRGRPGQERMSEPKASRDNRVHEFRVWAPGQASVDLSWLGGRRLPMRPRRWRLVGRGPSTAPDRAPTTRSASTEDRPRPDPRSPFQPEGIHGPSRVVDHAAFAWTDARWRGLPLAGSVLYECHVGTFSAEGTFDGAIEHLGHLAGLGVDAIELMPVAEFSGARGWGYDGVDLFAPHHAYGGPDGLKRLVDAAHARGLGVVHGRRLQPPRPGGELPARVRPLLLRAAPDQLGRRRSTSTVPAATRCAGSSSTTR